MTASTALALTANNDGLPVGNAAALGQFVQSLKSSGALASAKALAAAYDEACHALVGPNDVQEDGGKTFKKKSAWRKLARHFGISTEVVKTLRVREDDTASGGRTEIVATVIVRATAPWGQQAEAVGVCSSRERRFGRETAFAKADADCMATAETRATNRAVSNLIAAGEVSAEEIAIGGETAPRAAARPAPRATATAQPGTLAEAAEVFDAEVVGTSDNPACPKCGGEMWDDRQNKRNPNAPDFKCKNKPKERGGPGCEGVIWPPKDAKQSRPAKAAKAAVAASEEFADFPAGVGDGADDDNYVPF